ncbi:hypothetical protein [Pseudomonas fluorescens]|uniref:Uncharacterized protein n=1 Tax=Pseudomonas fluorescens TaxID=294 RepID=A0A944DJP2_PSEFL|nr:hypothetical protein [Pseudomonas fluorescens]MBT2293815.1 hypothetical protein [Pseudomonas fluorescens]MBT2307528.1 hypothetical protein [Pseudomonas fluorescens]MBT2311461.1 hypothetical protein [Pseudomonas fluorescens]MBT2319484.1 hypothetical protein [Pseudomonas fluorescens]MBT2330451.1 hypothetical protein [Pseudomonas fluorescens]
MTQEDVDGDRTHEVVLEIYKGKQLQFATFVSASKKNGPYDTVNVKTDADGDGDMDRQDEKAILDLANAFSKFK